ncbi:MAG: hypothetical protein ACRC35_02165 [Angustibacter sp.]
MTSRSVRTAADRAMLRPHIAEWFGHRVFPVVDSHDRARADQLAERCPFLSQVAETDMTCVKAANSKGVCTVSAGSNGHRQDWLVCPHRALDDDLLHHMVRRLFGVAAAHPVHVIPITNLTDERWRRHLVEAVRDGGAARQFLAFQHLFGGEVALPRSPASPELSFDVTVVEVVPTAGSETGVQLGRYGMIEIQTTDTHGSYRHAVEALRAAQDLHSTDFAEQVAAHPEWPGRRVEGPNISNVFKRTFYQIMFKFQIARRHSSTGCILALPRPVWDSWQPFLGAPDLVRMAGGTYALCDPRLSSPTGQYVHSAPNWIYVFDISGDPSADGSPTPIDVQLVVETDARTLSSLALDLAPARAIGADSDADTIMLALRRRARAYIPDLD